MWAPRTHRDTATCTHTLALSLSLSLSQSLSLSHTHTPASLSLSLTHTHTLNSYLFGHSFVHSLTHSILAHSFIHLLTHSFTHSLTHTPNHSVPCTKARPLKLQSNAAGNVTRADDCRKSWIFVPFQTDLRESLDAASDADLVTSCLRHDAPQSDAVTSGRKRCRTKTSSPGATRSVRPNQHVCVCVCVCVCIVCCGLEFAHRVLVGADADPHLGGL